MEPPTVNLASIPSFSSVARDDAPGSKSMISKIMDEFAQADQKQLHAASATSWGSFSVPAPVPADTLLIAPERSQDLGDAAQQNDEAENHDLNHLIILLSSAMIHRR
jgi:hypothetical protein